MLTIPGYSLPKYSEEVRDDALFHYTTGSGLVGIFETQALWCTAYFCANDESELSIGRGVLMPMLVEYTSSLIKSESRLVQVFASRGVEIWEYTRSFEASLVGFALNTMCPFISCFCKPAGKEDFTNGLLSQWRGYGSDGGYALQLSKKKLRSAIERANVGNTVGLLLQDVYYTQGNPLRDKILTHSAAFQAAFQSYLEEIAKPMKSPPDPFPNPIRDLFGGPIESLLEYLTHTKSSHFSEERECRLSTLEIRARDGVGQRGSFNRGGVPVPYRAIPFSQLDILSCVESIVIGPAPRMAARFHGVASMIRNANKEISIRPSTIPYVRV